MSADDPVEDKAKARAEERAEKELQLKIDALELEREKFRYSRGQASRDRLSAAVVRAATALLVANASVLVICLNSYKSLTEVVPVATLYKSISALEDSFALATLAFTFALALSVSSFSTVKKLSPLALGTYFMFGATGIPSVCMFLWALTQALKAVKLS